MAMKAGSQVGLQKVHSADEVAAQIASLIDHQAAEFSTSPASSSWPDGIMRHWSFRREMSRRLLGD
jgi:hypothetical protein